MNGLLIEESRTNSLTYSSAIASTNWNSYNSLATALNNATAPDGTTTATTLSDPSAVAWSLLQQPMSNVASNGQTWTASVYIKKDTNTARFPQLDFGFTGGTSIGYAIQVNTQAGAFSTGQSSGTPSSAGTQEVGSYWRVWVAGTDNSSENTNMIFELWPAISTTIGGSSNAATGSTTFWGAQLEQGAMPTSYIPTTTAAMTRSADIASVPNSSLYNGSQGTLVASAISGYLYASSNAGGIYQTVASLETDTNNRATLRRTARGTTSTDGVSQQAYKSAGNVILIFASSNGTWPMLSPRTSVISYSNNNFASSFYGSIMGTSNSGAVFTPSLLTLGYSAYFGSPLNGWLQSVQYYNSNLTNIQIQQISHP